MEPDETGLQVLDPFVRRPSMIQLNFVGFLVVQRDLILISNGTWDVEVTVIGRSF